MALSASVPTKRRKRAMGRLTSPSFFDRPMLDCLVGLFPATRECGLEVVETTPGQFRLQYDLTPSTVRSPFLHLLMDPEIGLLSHKLSLLAVLVTLVSSPSTLPTSPHHVARLFNKMPAAWCDSTPHDGPAGPGTASSEPGSVGDLLTPYAAVEFAARKLAVDVDTVPLRTGEVAREWVCGYLDGQLALRYDRVGLLPRPMLLSACDPRTLPTLATVLGSNGVLWRSSRHDGTASTGAGWVWALYGEATATAAEHVARGRAVDRRNRRTAGDSGVPPENDLVGGCYGSALWAQQSESWTAACALYRVARGTAKVGELRQGDIHTGTATGSRTVDAGESSVAYTGQEVGGAEAAAAEAPTARTRSPSGGEGEDVAAAGGEVHEIEVQSEGTSFNETDADGVVTVAAARPVRSVGGGVSVSHGAAARVRRRIAARKRAAAAATTAAAVLSRIAEDVAASCSVCGVDLKKIGVPTLSAMIRLRLLNIAAREASADGDDVDDGSSYVAVVDGSRTSSLPRRVSVKGLVRRLSSDRLASLTAALAVRVIHGADCDEDECAKLMHEAVDRAGRDTLRLFASPIPHDAPEDVKSAAALAHQKALSTSLIADEMMYLLTSVGIREAAAYVSESVSSAAPDVDRRGEDGPTAFSSAGPLVLQQEVHRQLLRRPDHYVRLKAPPPLPTAQEAVRAALRGQSAV